MTANELNIGLGQFGASVALASIDGAVKILISLVFFGGCPTQVSWVHAGGDTASMSNLMCGRWLGAMHSLADQDMNARFPMPYAYHAVVPLAAFAVVGPQKAFSSYERDGLSKERPRLAAIGMIGGCGGPAALQLQQMSITEPTATMWLPTAFDSA